MSSAARTPQVHGLVIDQEAQVEVAPPRFVQGMYSRALTLCNTSSYYVLQRIVTLSRVVVLWS